MTDKPTAAEQFAAFFEQALPPRGLAQLLQTDPDPETEENDQ